MYVRGPLWASEVQLFHTLLLLKCEVDYLNSRFVPREGTGVTRDVVSTRSGPDSISRRKRHQPLEQVRCCLDSSTQTLAILEVLHCPSRPVTVVNVRGGPKPHGDLSGTVA